MTLPYLADEQKPRSQSSVTTSSDAATTAPSASEATTSAACSPTPSPSSAPRPSPDGRKAFQPAFAEKVEEETSGDYAAFPGSYSRAELLQYRWPAAEPGSVLPRYRVTSSATPEKIMGMNLLQTLKRKA